MNSVKTFGVGIKDNDYPLVKKKLVNGKWVIVWVCPFYAKWKDMLMRCYSEKYLSKHTSYVGCSVCEEWLTFSSFKNWMEKQEYKGKQLDKDLLFVNNKVYSPITCVFVDPLLNSFIINDKCGAGYVGANWHKRDKVYGSNISNPFSGKLEFLGNFKTAHEAHCSWVVRKNQLVEELITHLNIEDEAIINALRSRYK